MRLVPPSDPSTGLPTGLPASSLPPGAAARTDRPARRRSLAAACVLALGCLAAAVPAAADPVAQAAGIGRGGHGAFTGLQPVGPAPAVGAKGVVQADPTLPRPPVTPCVVPLFFDFTFVDFSDHLFDYAPAAACKGPYAKVVLEADFSVNAGRQFDRTASIAVGGVNLYFGTTQEPSADVAPTWHVERDITEYASVLAQPQKGRVDLGNVVDGTYTGILRGSGRIVFYPAHGPVKAAPSVADLVVPFSNNGNTGGVPFLASGSSTLQRTLDLPTNLTRAYLDVYAQSQAGDEFWWTCVPDALAATVQDCGGGTFREAWITVDGQPAGVAPVYPWIYTGGIDPGAWRPTPGVQTLNFVPYRVDLTPFAGVLSDGRPHTVALAVAGANNGFAVTANLLLYRDPFARRTGGAVTENTLAAQQPGGEVDSNTITTSNGVVSGGIRMEAGRSFAISGYVDTARGRVTTRVAQQLHFSNQQQLQVSDALYAQTIDQLTTLQSETTTDARATRGGPPWAGRVTDRQQLRFPVFLDYRFDNTANTQNVTIRQAYQRRSERSDGRQPLFRSDLGNAIAVSSGLKFDPNGGPTVRTGENGTQAVRYTDSLGSCYDRRITTTTNALSAVVDAGKCPDGNLVDWRAQPDGAPEQGLLEWLTR